MAPLFCLADGSTPVTIDFQSMETAIDWNAAPCVREPTHCSLILSMNKAVIFRTWSVTNRCTSSLRLGLVPKSLFQPKTSVYTKIPSFYSVHVVRLQKRETVQYSFLSLYAAGRQLTDCLVCTLHRTDGSESKESAG